MSVYYIVKPHWPFPRVGYVKAYVISGDVSNIHTYSFLATPFFKFGKKAATTPINGKNEHTWYT